MASKLKTQRPVRFDHLSDEEIMARWKSLQPKFVRSLVFFAGAALFLFITNHFFGLSQTMTNITNVAFQIASIFTVCFVVLTCMGLYFGTGKWRKTASSK